MRKGFSLAETILALGLLGTLLVLALFLMPSCVMTYRSAQQQAQAESLGQSRLERLRAEPYEDLKDGKDAPEVREAVEYHVSHQLVAEPDCQPAEARRAQVTVKWTYRARDYQWTGEETLHAPL